MEEKNSLLKTKERQDHRLKQNKQFNYIYKKGERKSSKNFTLFTVPSRFNCFKIGITVNKKLGKANIRNRLKRRIREIVRLNSLPKSFHNYILMAREGSQDLSYDEMQKQIIGLFK